MNPSLILLAMIALLALNIAPFAVAGEYRRKTGKPFLAPTWSVWHLLYVGEAVILLLLVMTTFYFVPLTVLAKPLGLDMPALTKAITANDFANIPALVWFFLPATILQNVAFFAAPAAAIAGFYNVRLRDIGLPAFPPRRAVVAGLILGVVFLLVSGGLGYGLETLARRFEYLPFVKAMLHVEETNPVAQLAGSLRKAGIPGLILGVLAVGIAAPLGEEMLFRGFAQNVLTRRFGVIVGVVGSALLFAAPHTYSLLGLSVIFLMGLALAHIYRVGGSLWTCIIIHAVNNTVQIVLAYFVR
ncbi:MAG: CPBP family intramembrane metalloprotease [Armatimonadetes bacterium]|nr:CPBP family intramembrane metalloprotease [Armatimonadota bacterium]